MTAFPIAIGMGPHRSSSSASSSRDELVAINNNDDDTLSATVHIHYRTLPNDDTAQQSAFNVVAELRVRIQSTESSVSSSCASVRETKCRVPLGKMTFSSQRRGQHTRPRPRLSFSRRHLTVLVPFPPQYDTHDESIRLSAMVVVFSIRQESYTIHRRTEKKQPLPPLPYYVEPTVSSAAFDSDGTAATGPNANKNDTVSYAAHDPRILRAFHPSSSSSSQSPSNNKSRHDNNSNRDWHPIQTVTSVCDLPTGNNSSCLLLGTNTGSLLLANYASARVVRRTPPLDDDDTATTTTTTPDRTSYPIVHISQCPPDKWNPLDAYGRESGSASSGRVGIVTLDGCAVVYSTSFTPPPRLSDKNDSEEEMSMEVTLIPLCTFGSSSSSGTTGHPNISVAESDNRPLSYARVKMLKPYFLVLLARQSNDIDTENGGTIHPTFSSSSSEMVVAQVWSIRDDSASSNNNNTYDGDEKHRVASLVSELKLPLGNEDSMKERSHYNSCRRTCSSTTSDSECFMTLSHHRETDCLALSTQCLSIDSSSSRLRINSCCLIWDWKRHVTGLTLFESTSFDTTDASSMSEPYSIPLSFYIRKSSTNGLSAIHIYQTTSENGQKKWIHRDEYRLGLLSPNNSHCASVPFPPLGVYEPNALVLGYASILYPFLDRSLQTQDGLLRWEECNIPSSYLLNNGYCHLATASSDGRSIAVAADRGLCILDLGRISEIKDGRQSTPQWKLFRRVNEEKSFRVLHMVWWNRNVNRTNGQYNKLEDDILLAIIQYRHDDQLTLVGWSRRRLGFGDDQLVVEASIPLKDQPEANNRSTSGLVLPGSRLHSASIIADPSGGSRALLLVTLYNHGADSVMKCVIYQLQINTFSQRKSEFVLARMSASGITTLESQDTSGVFLAGGSFSFDLCSDQQHKDSPFKPTAIIGAITMSRGLVAIALFQSKPTIYESLTLDSTEDTALSNPAVSYHKADVFSDGTQSCIAWNIAKSDGTVYCWVVPCSFNFEDSDNSTSSIQFVCNDLDVKQHRLTGQFCHLGASSLWLNGASTNENEIIIGQCTNMFACNLFAGQRSRKITTSNQSTSALHVSNCIIGPPQFTSLLYLSLLIPTMTEQHHSIGKKFFREYIKSRLASFEKMSTLSSFRVIVFKILDLLSTTDAVSTKWTTGKQMLKEVVHTLRDSFDVLTNTTFWLSVGRQLEPHQFDLIFPLPSNQSELSPMSTAEDLFVTSCANGSLSSALSALPLFSCHMASQKRVVQLVYHCLDAIMRSFESLSVSTEEIKFIHQLFWFGVKLEDAIESLDSISSGLSCVESIASVSTETSNSSSSSSSSSDDTDTDCLSVDSNENSLISRQAAGGSAKTGIISKVVTNLFPPKTQVRHANEDAIHDAASNFIMSGFDSPVKSRLTTPLPIRQDIARTMRTQLDLKGDTKRRLSFDESTSKHDPLDYSDATVAGAVATFIGSVVGPNKDSNSRSSGWKILSLVAHLLQGDRESVAITAAASENARNITRASTIKVDNSTIDGGNDTDIIVQFFERLVDECTSQIQPDAAGTIFNLILLLLLRYDTCEDVHASKTTLITVGIVVGRMSGRIAELIDDSSEIHYSLVKFL